MEINSTIAALFFYLFPIVIGRPITRFFVKKDLPMPFITYFLTGLFTLFAATVGVNFILGTIFRLPFLPIFQGVIALLAFLLIPIHLVLSKEDLKFKPYILPFIASCALGVGVFLLFFAKSPYPLNWDLYEHETLAQNILSGRFSIIPSQVTDTFGFNGYSTIFHTLLAAPQAFIKISALPLWNALDLFHLITVIFASYLLGKSVSGKKSVGYLSAILGGVIFDSLISFTNLFLMPQTFTAVIFILLFVQLLEMIKKKQELSLPFIALNTIAIFLNHFVIGFAAAILYLGSALYFKFGHVLEAKVKMRIVAEVIFILMLIAISFSGFISLGSINKGEAAAFNLTLTDKFEAMRQAYGLLPLFILPLGFAFILRSKKKFEIMIAFITAFLLGGILMQVPYVMKFFVLAKFFIGVVLALGINRIISNISNKVIYAASYVVIIVALAALFVTNATIWKGILQYGSLNTQVSDNEIQAAQFLKQNYSGKNVLMVSDPATQNILEALSGINSQGGAYMDISTRKKMISIKDTTEASKFAPTLFQINDLVTPASNTRLLVLGGRYFEWQNSTNSQKLDLSYNIWHPTDLSLTDKTQINTIISQVDGIKLVYENPGLVILELNQSMLK